jgi:dCMP deaminase
MSTKWDHRYLDMAMGVAQWSKDPSSKIGAVAVGNKGQVLAQGFNGFPRNIKDEPSRLTDRETKYKFMIHAEMNAIYNATYNGVSLDGATLYVHGLPCCANCALGVIQVGIKRVVMRGKPKPQWEESFEMMKQLFNESNVEWEIL